MGALPSREHWRVSASIISGQLGCISPPSIREFSSVWAALPGLISTLNAFVGTNMKSDKNNNNQPKGYMEGEYEK